MKVNTLNYSCVFYKGAQERLDAGSIGLVQRTSGAEKLYIFNCEKMFSQL